MRDELNGFAHSNLQRDAGIPAPDFGEDFFIVLPVIRSAHRVAAQHSGMDIPSADDRFSLAVVGNGTALRTFGFGVPERHVLSGIDDELGVLVSRSVLFQLGVGETGRG